jgi:hypothetical protein
MSTPSFPSKEVLLCEFLHCLCYDRLEEHEHPKKRSSLSLVSGLKVRGLGRKNRVGFPNLPRAGVAIKILVLSSCYLHQDAVLLL